MPVPIPQLSTIEDNPPSQNLIATLEEVQNDNPIATSTFPTYYV